MENNLSLAEQWNNLQPELIQSFGDSLYMISVSIVITVIVGLFLGIVLFLTSNRLLFKNVFIYKTVLKVCFYVLLCLALSKLCV